MRAGVPNTVENQEYEQKRFRRARYEIYVLLFFPCIGIKMWPEHTMGMCPMKVCEKCHIDDFDDNWKLLVVSGEMKDNKKNRRIAHNKWIENGNKMPYQYSPEAIGKKGTQIWCEDNMPPDVFADYSNRSQDFDLDFVKQFDSLDIYPPTKRKTGDPEADSIPIDFGGIRKKICDSHSESMEYSPSIDEAVDEAVLPTPMIYPSIDALPTPTIHPGIDEAALSTPMIHLDALPTPMIQHPSIDDPYYCPW